LSETQTKAPADNATVLSYLDLSTGNLTEQTCNEWLPMVMNTTSSNVIAYPKGEYGYFVHVSEDLDELEDDPSASTEYDFKDVPADLLGVLVYARAHGCQWVQFDRDGDVNEDLPHFDWRKPEVGDPVFLLGYDTPDQQVTPGMTGTVVADPDGEPNPGAVCVMWNGPINPFLWAVQAEQVGVLETYIA
jgi:hypothetical protein